MFEPRVALASLSGDANAEWAATGAPFAGAAFLGGIALCEQTQTAARALRARGRSEFLPSDPFAFIDAQFGALSDVPIRPGINVRATDPMAISRAVKVCREHDAILEINAHCRQAEMCTAGAGESLLTDLNRLGRLVEAGSTLPALTVKVRAEVPSVDLVEVAETVQTAGATGIHIDAMDTEHVIQEVVDATDLFVIANNGVRDEATVAEYANYGADAVSVGRPSDRPAVLARVNAAVDRHLPAIDRRQVIRGYPGNDK